MPRLGLGLGLSKISNKPLGGGGSANTPRTQAFLDATRITDPTIISTLNTFDTAVIAAGLLPSGTGAGILKAVYPMVGGTATTHKYNFVDPQDTDAAYRLTFSGGWTHSSTGALPNGTNAYADTYLSPNAIGLDSLSFGYYSRTNNTRTSWDMGISPNCYINIKWTNNNAYWQNNGGQTNADLSAVTSQGLFSISRISSSVESFFRNKVEYSGDKSSTSASTNSIFIGAANNGSSAFAFSNRETAFNYIGTGLTDTRLNELYDAIQALETSLGRNV